MCRFLALFCWFLLPGLSLAQSKLPAWEAVDSLISIQQYEQARDKLLALKVSAKKPKPDWNLACMSRLSRCYLLLGKTDSLQLYMEQAQNAAKKVPANSLAYTDLLLLEAEYALAKSDLSEAQKNYDEALPLFEKWLGTSSLPYLQTLEAKASVLYSLGQIQAAEQAFARCISIAEQKEEFRPLLFSYKISLASMKMALGKYQEAVDFFEELRKSEEAKQNKQWYAILLNNLASCYMQSGQMQKAMEMFGLFVPEAEQVFGKNSVEYITASANYANLLMQMGFFEKAEQLLLGLKELCIQRFGAAHSQVLWIESNLLMVYKQTIRLELAQACFVRAMDIAKKLGIEEAKLSTLIQNYAGLCQDHGLFKEAERYYERAASIRKQTQGQNSQEYVIALANWASLYAQQGNLTKAISLYEQALRYWPESLKQSRYYANTLCNLSSFYAELGEKWKAEQLAAQALGICEKYHLLDIELWMACQEAIASALELRDSPKEAFEVRKKTLARSGAEYADRNPYAPSLHTKLAQYYTKMGFYATADSLLSLAQKGILRMYGRDHLLSCQTQLELAELRLFMGKASEALPLCEQAALFLQKNYPRQYWLLARLQGLKAEALFQLKNYELALEAIEQALLFTKKGAEQVYASLTEQERMLYEEQNAQPYLLKAYQYLAAMGKADRLLSLSLSNKGDLLHEAREIQEQLSLSKDQSTKDKLQELVDLKQRIGNAHGLSKYDLKSRGLNLDSLEHRATLLEKELNQHPALQSKLQNNKSYDWAKLKAALKEKEAAVEILCFYVDRKTGKVQDTLALGKPWFDRVKSADSICYIALLVRPNAKLPELIFLKDGQFLNGQALAYYTNCIQMRIKDKKSYEWFWAPLEGKLQGVEKLYISAEGVYHQVNPATFYNEAQKKYLGEYLSIEPLSSLRELLQKRPLVQAKDAILLGRPSFSTEGSQQDTLKGNSTRSATRFASMVQSGLSDLPATEKEVKQIDSLLKTKALQSKVLLFAQATEDTLKQLRSPSVLHVATHGFFISEQHQGPSKNPMLSSGILLSGVLDFYQGKRELSENDGVLTAFEAMHISLQHTNLVVLSACETGLGHQQIGEGVYGLQRAFKVAGARYVLMSLWKVDDAVTQQLMVLFYTHWLSGMEISAAFHKAQAEIRALYPQPYFWGAFVLLG